MRGQAGKEKWHEKFKRKAFVIRSFEDHENDRAHSGHAMHRCLGALDLVMLGIGEFDCCRFQCLDLGCCSLLDRLMCTARHMRSEDALGSTVHVLMTSHMRHSGRCPPKGS